MTPPEDATGVGATDTAPTPVGHSPWLANAAARADATGAVVRAWRSAVLEWGPPISTLRETHPDLTQALDRLSATYRRDGAL